MFNFVHNQIILSVIILILYGTAAETAEGFPFEGGRQPVMGTDPRSRLGI